MTSTVMIDGEAVQITNGDRENARAWFMYSEVDYSDASMALTESPMDYFGLDASIALIRDYLNAHVQHEECFILGFSQGATFCHIISMLTHAAKQSDEFDADISPFAKIRKAILISGFSSMHERPLAACMKDTRKTNIQVQSLHIFGENDTSVPKPFCVDLAKCFVNSEIYVHEKGHFIPHNKPLLDQVVHFLESDTQVGTQKDEKVEECSHNKILLTN